MNKLTLRCNKCGKEPELDKEKSNENWKVFKTDKPCECGGKFILSDNNMNNIETKLKPVTFVKGQYNYHRQNLLQQNLLLKALQITTDPNELKKMIGVKTVAEVYRTLDKIAIRKEYHEALLRNHIDLDSIVKGIKDVCEDNEESGAVKLKGWQMILKSLGLDNYSSQDLAKESSSNWEELVKNSVNKIDSPKKEKIIEGDYEVKFPVQPEAEKVKEKEEEVFGKGLYDEEEE